MFIETQSPDLVEEYNTLLKKVGALSRLYSVSDKPFLYYRSAERIFCHTLNSADHTRSDIAVDTSKNQSGIGLKTFTYKGRGSSFQKISEFNRLSTILREYYDSRDELIKQLAHYYNNRLDTAFRMIGLDRAFFHCVVRRQGGFLINEYPMRFINHDSLEIISTNIDNDNERLRTIDFLDTVSNTVYKFNTSKSTLYRKFDYQYPIYEIPISIIPNPFDFLGQIDLTDFGIPETEIENIIYLPLYAYHRGTNDIYVPEKSGLNHWNAGGRSRDANEVYIPVYASIHINFPNFFPQGQREFNLKLPNGRVLSARVCQANRKALMSNPNKELGEWILRDVLEMPRGELVDYDDLLDKEIDSVEVRKIDDENYEIDFKDIGTYEEFREAHLS